VGRDNPQRRARVLMKFVDLLHRDMDKLAEALSREHGKTHARRQGRRDQRGIEKWPSSASARRTC
jgi:malonate-semialdehyde dehydrogenase (acetylating)/methylmalonate-semialdehyde dehydrogenase